MDTRDFVKTHNITATAKRVDGNPNSADFGQDARHWLVTLNFEGRKISIHFSQGSAHKDPPTAEDVLDCLALDSYGSDLSLEDFASEYGYDLETSKGKARRILTAIQENTAKLRNFVGERYDELLEAERL